MGNIFAIGDIHGSLEKVGVLMDQLAIVPERDTLLFIGDYIDRGPYAYEVIEYMLDLQRYYPHTVFLKGNHELMLENFLAGIDTHFYLSAGGQATVDSYLHYRQQNQEHPLPKAHLAFFKSLRLYYETDHYIFVHAGLRPHIPLHKQKAEDLLWIREPFIHSDYDFGKQVVFGHTPFRQPLVQDNKIGIDTGAVYGNRLTCVQLPGPYFYQA